MCFFKGYHPSKCCASEGTAHRKPGSAGADVMCAWMCDVTGTIAHVSLTPTP